MLRNYLKIALRNIKKQKLYSCINIFGLAIGLACTIIIILFLNDENSFDKFNHNYNRIARILTTSQSNNKTVHTYSFTPGILGEMLKTENPEVEDYVTIMDHYRWGRFTVEHNENKYYESEYLITEPSFLKIFNFKLLEGKRGSLLNEPNEIVLTRSASKKLFGNEDPVGKIIKTDRSWGNFKVTGVLQDPPLNSHLQFDMLISMQSLSKLNGFSKAMSNLDLSLVRTYLLFKPGYNIYNFSSKLKKFESANKSKNFGVTESISLQPLADIHFDSGNIEYDLNAHASSKTPLYILSIIGLLIILIAVINYSNLASAKSLGRMKEIGVRAVIGAGKKQLIQQFLVESLSITCISLGTAFFLVELALPIFNNFTGKTLSLWSRPAFIEVAAIIIITLFIILLSGILPSFLITKLKTVFILKGRLNPRAGFSLIGKGLVITQFAISIIMIFCTVTIYKQMEYIRNKGLGFNEDNLLVIDINSSGSRNNFIALKNEFQKNPNVKSVSVTSRVPGDWKTIDQLNARILGENKENGRKMFYIGADYDFINTFGIDLLDGRNFENNYSSDSTNIIINEEAALTLGLKNPIGKSLTLSDGNRQGTYKIIGIVKDFNFQSLHEKISPMVIGCWNNQFAYIDYYTVRISSGNISQTIKYLSSAQQNFDNVTPFEYNFLDERMKDFYKQDEREAAIINFASALAVLIACLGLFGLAAFTSEKRTKEIGVRKVLGASISGIVVLFSQDFLKLVLIANLFSLPIAYYLMQGWLNEFAYRINIGLSTFLISGMFAFIFALMTVSYQAIKSATANPVKSLRYE